MKTLFKIPFSWLTYLGISLCFLEMAPAQTPGTDSIPTIPRPADFDTTNSIQQVPPLQKEWGPETEAFPTLSKLFSAIDSFHATQCAANLAEFQESHKGRWLSWLPTIGASYVPSLDPGQPDRLRPTLSYSLATVERNQRERVSRRAKRNAIAARSRVDAQLNKEKVWEMVQRRTLLLEQYQHQEEIFAIDCQLFEFYTTQFHDVKIPADFYLGEQKKYLDRQFALEQSRLQIRQLETEIIAAAHLIPVN